MSLQQAEEPPPYTSDSKDLSLPSVPSADPQSLEIQDPRPTYSPTSLHGRAQAALAIDPGLTDSKPSNPGIVLHPVELPNVPGHEPSQADGSAAANASSYEDPNDRMAAEALCGLGKAESKRTPASDFETPLKYFPIGIEHTQPGSDGEQAEPLLSLLTSSHPWLGGTINGSLSAYSATKSFSPRFIRSGADRIESTVGNVGKVTGVEESLRKYLEQGRPDQSNQDVTMDIEQGPSTSAVLQSHGQRTASGTLSIDTLPAYDKNSSPPYEDNRSTGQPAPVANMRPATNRSWSSQLMISTSGLGAALSERSLQSLKFCLSILTKANQHVKNLMDALKRLLQDLKGPSDSGAIEKKALEAGDQDAMQLDERPDKNIIADRIRHLNEEIWQTLRGVVNAVSSYTGGALPENASVVVRWQLMSVPQRWKRAITKVAPQGSDDAASSANRMLAFAIEGIDMMEQVSGVVDSTITSAEKWLDSLGRGGQKQQEQGQAAGDESAGGQATAGAEESQQVADDSGGA